MILFRGIFWRLWPLSNICCYTLLLLSLQEGLELHFSGSWQMLLSVNVVDLTVRWVRTSSLVCSAMKHKDLAEASDVCWEWLWGLKCSDDFVSCPWLCVLLITPVSLCSPWCGRSDDFCGFSLIFAEPGLEKEVGKSKITLFGLWFALQSSTRILLKLFILKLGSGDDCTS